MYAYKTNINDHFIHLFFMRRSSKELLLKNYEIFIMNAIYKINKYKMLLLIINGQIIININFYVDFCFLSYEKIIDYRWILKKLFELYKYYSLFNSTIIVTNIKTNIKFMHFFIYMTILTMHNFNDRYICHFF